MAKNTRNGIRICRMGGGNLQIGQSICAARRTLSDVFEIPGEMPRHYEQSINIFPVEVDISSVSCYNHHITILW